MSQPPAGFRAGLDSVLLGAAVRAGAECVLDLGAGAGTAALVALADRPGAHATLVEIDPAMAALAEANLAANGMQGRGTVLCLDLTATAAQRRAGGLAADRFDSVIANPPFFAPGRGTAPAAARAGARHMPVDALERWVRAAATHAANGGEVIFIHVATALPALLAALGTRFGAVNVLPLLPRAGQPAHRVLVRGIKGSRAPFTLLAARPLHEDGGRTFRPEFEAIFRGAATLVW